MARPKKSTPVAQAASPNQAAVSDARISALAHAVTELIIERLREDMPIYARIAAADTRHTLQRPETVLADAIDEGKLAAKILKEKTKED